MRQVIWQYWSGPKSPAIRLCEKSVERHSGHWKVKRLDDRAVHEMFPELRPDWDDIPLASHRADYLRAMVLYHHGGVWLDSDYVVWKSMDFWTEMLLKCPLAIIGTPQKASSNCIGARDHDWRIGKWVAACDDRLDRSLTGEWWRLCQPMWKLTEGVPRKPLSYAQPIRGPKWRTMFQVGRRWTLESRCHEGTWGMHLFNEASKVVLDELSEDALMRHLGILGQAFRRALG